MWLGSWFSSWLASWFGADDGSITATFSQTDANDTLSATAAVAIAATATITEGDDIIDAAGEVEPAVPPVVTPPGPVVVPITAGDAIRMHRLLRERQVHRERQRRRRNERVLVQMVARAIVETWKF